MSDFNRGYAPPTPTAPADMAVDAGLRSFMLGVYNKMMLGLVLAAGIAWTVGNIRPISELLYNYLGDRVTGLTPLGWAVAFAPLGVLLISMFAMRNPSPRTAGILYWTVVSLIGAGLGVLSLVYTGTSIFSTFLITAAAFGGLSLLGYTTKKDLTGFGSFLIIGLVGLVIASLVNMFLQNSVMGFLISVVGVLIFAGLIAFDTQRLKMSYYQMGGDQAAMGVATNYGALSLYLNFINLFQFLLSIFGNRR